MVLDTENRSWNKRQAVGDPQGPNGFIAAKTRCPLLLLADYSLFRGMGGGSTKTTINYLVSNIIQLKVPDQLLFVSLF